MRTETHGATPVLISLSAFGASEVRRHGQLWFSELSLVAGADGVEVRSELLTDPERELPAIALAVPLGYRLRIFDALRPVEAQWALWNVNPDPEFLADPRRGSPHSRGVAVDLTLIDPQGHDLDMGTGFDAFTPLSHHGRTDVSAEAQRNRLVLMGLMTTAGWDFYRNEWWHYQLFDARRFPLVCDADLPRPML